MYGQDVGLRLRHVRESLRLSRREVEERSRGEFKESILAMYENAKRRIPTPRLQRLADIYGVSASFLLGESVIPERGAPMDVEALLMSDPKFSEDERALIKNVLSIIKAKRRAEGKE
ncbi:MAG: helix-turn-helix domain-containing protein [Actinobacteria bacterium]|nr:helix-turn-helix domain-containing protein [Actinomycetota bacterium]